MIVNGIFLSYRLVWLQSLLIAVHCIRPMPAVRHQYIRKELSHRHPIPNSLLHHRMIVIPIFWIHTKTRACAIDL
jgi:hypothetical protein